MSENVTTIKSLYAAFGAGDTASILSLISKDIEWIVAKGGLYGGVFIGPQDIMKNLIFKLGSEWDKYSAVPHEFIAEPGSNTVIVLGNYDGIYKKTDKSFKAPYVHAWTVENKKVIRFEQFTDTVLQLQVMES